MAVLLVLLATMAGHCQSAATVNVAVNQPGAVVSSNLFGIFFEEINYAGDGGIYGEMVRNRSFAQSSNPDYWTLVTSGTAQGSMTVDSTQPLNTNLLSSLKLTLSSGSGSVGAANSGYWGMALQSGAAYHLSFYAAAPTGFSGSITAKLENAAGTVVYAQSAFGGLSGSWQKYSASLVSSATDTNAQLVLSISQSGSVWLDMVSLFPAATFDNRTNGLRADLANLLAALHPSFMRYPGGNFIEANQLVNSVRWKKTIGDVARRPGHQNDAWGYWSTDGYGFDEYARQCEDMGMHLLYGINAGLALGYNGSTNNTVPLDQMGPWVQDALDLIQYANGDTNTTWGALRAANGHPAPYNLQYMEIGNENGGSY
ncbi:MAG TPA: carbohydrate binding domain-containing protein, partial [Verrucomicrobiae bacterium]|nr:carbohydrate binding domain-containing protein [Verrucomicrobiae bacterium]